VLITYDSSGTPTILVIDGQVFKTGLSGIPSDFSLRGSSVAYTGFQLDDAGLSTGVELHTHKFGKKTISGFAP